MQKTSARSRPLNVQPGSILIYLSAFVFYLVYFIRPGESTFLAACSATLVAGITALFSTRSLMQKRDFVGEAVKKKRLTHSIVFNELALAIYVVCILIQADVAPSLFPPGSDFVIILMGIPPLLAFFRQVLPSPKKI